MAEMWKVHLYYLSHLDGLIGIQIPHLTLFVSGCCKHFCAILQINSKNRAKKSYRSQHEYILQNIKYIVVKIEVQSK